MTLETQYFGVISSTFANAVTSDGVLVGDIIADADNLIAYYNARQDALLSVMGFRTNSPQADRVAQVRAKWGRFSEHGSASMRTRVKYDIAVSVAIEGYESLVEWTRWSEILGLSSTILNGFFDGVTEENLRLRYNNLLQTFFTNAPRGVEDEITKLAVVQAPFYYGASDTAVPPPAGNKLFSAGHNHFGRTATTGAITTTDLLAGVRNVTEHGFRNLPIIFGNEAFGEEVISIGSPDIAEFYGINPFMPQDATNANQPGAMQAQAQVLADGWDIVGVFKGRTLICVNDDIPDGYYGVFSHEGPLSQYNPLQVRDPMNPDMVGLRPYQETQYPFVNMHFEDHLGVGVRQRGNGAAYQWSYSGANTDPYVAPAWTEDLF